ncbi:hypothetical protein OUZ56_009039 [Daphnia magna]|uniref:Uncharacterized protein n=1 Tax=Daphnia magna TaxID=35525 RepID=A0ABR0AEU0_9CRUS|nr:hypothetical protein OUZ56_009039 [Daphnia magna]
MENISLLTTPIEREQFALPSLPSVYGPRNDVIAADDTTGTHHKRRIDTVAQVCTSRSLQAWQQHGRPHSELLRSQRDSEGGSTLGGPLRYDADRTLIFWVQCQQLLEDPMRKLRLAGNSKLLN